MIEFLELLAQTLQLGLRHFTAISSRGTLQAAADGWLLEFIREPDEADTRRRDRIANAQAIVDEQRRSGARDVSFARVYSDLLQTEADEHCRQAAENLAEHRSMTLDEANEALRAER